MVLMGLEQMLVFTKQLCILPGCKEGAPEVSLPFLLSETQSQLSATSSLCKGAMLLGRGDVLWH